jgi:hypothetical protein
MTIDRGTLIQGSAALAATSLLPSVAVARSRFEYASEEAVARYVLISYRGLLIDQAESWPLSTSYRAARRPRGLRRRVFGCSTAKLPKRSMTRLADREPATRARAQFRFRQLMLP